MTSMATKPSATSTDQAQVTENQVSKPYCQRHVGLCTSLLKSIFLLFPQSLTLMRNLLRTGVSTICYMRDIFGDEEFSVRSSCYC